MIYLNMYACMCLVAITDKHCSNFMDLTVLGPWKVSYTIPLCTTSQFHEVTLPLPRPGPQNNT